MTRSPVLGMKQRRIFPSGLEDALRWVLLSQHASNVSKVIEVAAKDDTLLCPPMIFSHDLVDALEEKALREHSKLKAPPIHHFRWLVTKRLPKSTSEHSIHRCLASPASTRNNGIAACIEANEGWMDGASEVLSCFIRLKACNMP